MTSGASTAVSTGLSRLPAFLEVTRPPNCLMAALLALLGLRLGGVAVSEDASGAWTVPAVLGLALGWLLLAQSTFTVNDYFDAPIDAVSHPDRPIPSGRIAAPDVLRLGVLAGCLGIGLLAVVSAALGGVALLYGLASFLYSAWLKARNGLLANAVVAGLIALVPITIGVTGVSIDRFAWISVPVFLGVFGREVLNDIEDLNGDRVLNRPTIPLLFGQTFAFRLAAASWACFLLGSYLPLAISLQSRTAGFALTSLVLSAPGVAIVLVLLRERHDLLTRLQLLTKAVLFAYVVVIMAAPEWYR